jgi:hypothetical protein
VKTVYTVDSKVKIKNEVGTSERSRCGCGPWIKHWEKFSKKSPSKCAVDGCTNNAIVGAHITRPAAEFEDYKTHSYIVPMCDEHNGKHGETFTSKENCIFVWANVSETCGKN